MADKCRIIGLHGPRQAGKDTVAAHLLNMRGYQRVAFADPMKDALSVAFGIPRAWFDDPGVKDARLTEIGGRTLRFLMQSFGTEWAQNVLGKRVWIDVAQRKIEALIDAGATRVVVTDVRFPTEADFMRELGAPVWLVHGHGPGFEEHSSAQRLPDRCLSAEINNNAGIGHLYTRVGEELAKIDEGRMG